MATIEIRDLEEDARPVLEARAHRSGLSLDEYLRRELERAAATPTPSEIVAEARSPGSGKGLSREQILGTIREIRGE